MMPDHYLSYRHTMVGCAPERHMVYAENVNQPPLWEIYQNLISHVGQVDRGNFKKAEIWLLRVNENGDVPAEEILLWSLETDGSSGDEK